MIPPPESCARCHGRGWCYPADPEDPCEVYCDCNAGKERIRVEGPTVHQSGEGDR